MPSRNIPPPPTPLVLNNYPLDAPPAPAPAPAPAPTPLLQPLAASGAVFSIFITIAVCFCKIGRKRTTTVESKPPHEFSYAALRRATASFSPKNRIGQGGFGSVFRGILSFSAPPAAAKNVAVKVMDSGSLQGEREFQNELFFASKLDSPHVVSVLGFSYERKRRYMLLVYELMENGNLQDALLRKRCPELLEWKQRFFVAVDIAKGIEYLHSLDPPVIHGDIKPSNILLDQLFSAKITDFGLARVKSEDPNQVEVTFAAKGEGLKLEGNGGGGCGAEDYGSVVEEVESVITNTTGFEEFNFGGLDQSPENIAKVPGSPMTASPEMTEAVTASPEMVEVVTASPDTTAVSASPETAEKATGLSANFDKSSIDFEKDSVKRNGKDIKSPSTKDWWWKQDNGLGRGKVKDYVMDWIGSEVKERPKSDWITDSSSSATSKRLDKKKSSKRLEWWISLDKEKEKKMKKRTVREWWKEEYCDELARKKKEKKKKTKRESETCGYDSSVDQWWPRDEELYADWKKNKKKRRGVSSNSRSSIDWWLDGLSGELWRARRNSHDSMSGEIAKSCGISSTPSMRGTVFYAAPEYGNIEDLSEKCDVYSYGVLLLVLVSGRRPLEVTGSAAGIQRANLISWARHLTRRGKLLDLVDQKVQSLAQEEALLCIKVALLCLQKSPFSRPSMKEVVGMLTGELGPPELPTEFSPSSPSRYPFKSRKKG